MTLVLDGVTVVSTIDGSLTEDRAVVIADDTIEAIVGSGDVPKDAEVVDATGQFVVPGYLDMHAHPLNWDDPSDLHALMLANGITGYRQMSGTDALLERRADGEDLTPGPAPELLAMPGEILMSANTRSAEQAAERISYQKELGADFIKLINLTPSIWLDAVRTAREAGLPVAGHMPTAVATEDAVEAGIGALEHFGGQDAVLIDASAEVETRADTAPPSEDDSGGHGPPAVGGAEDTPPNQQDRMKRFLANPMAFASAESLDRIHRVDETFDAGKCTALAEMLAERDVWQVPTLIRLRTMNFGDAAEYRENPDLRFMSQDDVTLWNEVADIFAELSAERHQQLASVFERYKQMTEIFADVGVPMLAGSDFGGGWLVPGFSLHDEFDLLDDSGLSPLQVLQMTTLNGARFLNRTDSMGTIEDGKRADLVLLDNNPVEDVANLHCIAGVVREGNYYSTEKLEALKTNVLKAT